ncbi:MAG TPA: HAMP domain-containing sensor histidine kinase [Thermoanaerobaculia bacterium]|nr:HAMP domain-containing sensor histidine kinase [Thermoanaerobaculia bacterium]
MQVLAAIRRSEAALLTVLVVAALLLAIAMTWRSIRAERNQRLIAARAIGNYSTLIAEELSRRTVFEYEQFGFRLLREQIALTWRQEHRVISAAEIRALGDPKLTCALPLLGETFSADLQAGTIDSTLPRNLQRAILAGLPAALAERRQPAFRILRLPGNHWIVYMPNPNDDRHVAGFLVRNEGLTELAARALTRRSPFPGILARQLNEKDLFLRITHPGIEIVRTPGAFQPRYGRRTTLPRSIGPILGGALVECSFSARAVPMLIAGGMPAGDEATPIVMLVATICVLGAVVLVLRRARELDRLRADFVAGVSHELRTPLTQIRMFAETLLLSRVRSEADRQRSLQNIARETTRLSHLVDNLLSFSRGERGTLQVVRTRHDVSAIVCDAVAAFASIATPSRARFHVDVAEYCVASVDEDALKQVVINLLDNALRYGPPGQTIDVSVAPHDDFVRISVEDEGRGIPAAERERIWMKFYRLERDRETNHTGSGIGLAVVREIVERHDGRCAVEDGSRGGARFVIDIPWGTAQ